MTEVMTMTLLADPAVDPTTGHGPEWGKAAPVALLIILLMGVALYFLIRSMNRHLKKVPESFETLPDASDDTVPSASSQPVLDDPADTVNETPVPKATTQ
jgi:hypothetical protein